MLPRTVEKPNKFMFQAPSPLDNREWQMLFLNSTSSQFPAGSKLLEEGSKNTDLWFLESGKLSVSKNDTIISTLKAGELFGDISFYTDLPCQYTVTSLSDCIVLRVPSIFVFSVITCGNYTFKIILSFFNLNYTNYYLDGALFEKFNWLMAKLITKRLILNDNELSHLSSALSSTSIRRSSARKITTDKLTCVKIYFSDETSQWFDCEKEQTVKSFRDSLEQRIDRGIALSDLAYARLYESCLNPVTSERQFNVLEDTWFMSTVLTRAKYASKHRIYFLAQVCKLIKY